MHHQIDSLAYSNRLRSLPPEQKLGFAMALFGLGYLVPAVGQWAIAAWLAVWIVGYAGIPLAVYSKLLALPGSFLLLSLPALAVGVGWREMVLTVQPDVLLGLPLGPVYLYLSRQGIGQAAILLPRAIALTSCLYFILLTVPFVELMRVLRQVKCPSLITELLTLMYRFIFVLTDTAVELLTAQQSRLGYRSWRTGMRSLGWLVGQLLQRTLENYRHISQGLASRGFAGDLKVWYTRRHKANPRYTLEAVSGCVILLILAGWHHAHGI
jgi:cobalt/nickel transport system permease protein